MTRFASNGNGHRTRVAALAASGNAWRLVVVEPGAPGGSVEADAMGGRARVTKAVTLRPDDAAGVRETLQQMQVDRLVRVAPAEQTVCKVQSAQVGDPGQTAAAMALIAEAELGGVAPVWRIGAGLIDDPGREGEGLALLTAWRDSSPAPEPVLSGELWTTEIAALAALRGGAGQLALSASRTSGVVSLLASGAQATVARTVRETNDTSDGWRSAVMGAAAETCAQVGAEVDTSEIEAGVNVVWLDTTARDTLRGRVVGVEPGPGWLSEYGVALGAALLALSDHPTRAPLAQLRASAPVQRRSVGTKVLETVASPRRAVAILAVAALVIALMPLAVAWSRTMLLEAGASRAAGFEDERRALAREAALYEHLERSRLPMTRLLADVAGATPPHVVIDRLRLTRDQGLSLEGRVHVVAGAGEAVRPENPQDLVTALERNLAAMGVFSGVRVNRSEVSEGSVQFEMTARVTRPNANPRPAIDFAERPLAQWLYGERGDNTARPVALRAVERSAAGGSRRAVSASGGTTAASATREGGREAPASGALGREAAAESSREASSRRPDGSGTASEGGVPGELTDAEIEGMDVDTARRSMVGRMTARTRSDVDEGTRARLVDEISRLRDHISRVQSAEGAGN